MDNVKYIAVERGTYLFKLEEVLHNRSISKNKLVRETNTDFKVIQRLARGEISRVDIIVLARLCDYLECGITDIIEYVRDN